MTDHEARVIINIDLITSVHQNSLEPIVLYPNPASNALTISMRDMRADQLEVTILDLQGQVIFQKKMNSSDVCVGETCQINTERLKPGIYLIKLNNRQRAEVRKFVKQ
jgi:hypothetical protein